MKYVDVGGSFEAGWDGYSCVVLRQEGTTGPSFHLTRQVLFNLLGLFQVQGNRDEFVVFESYEGDRYCGVTSLCLLWSETDVLIALRSKGYPLDKEAGHSAFFRERPSDREFIFRGWPSDKEFTLTWGKAVFRFVSLKLGGVPLVVRGF